MDELATAKDRTAKVAAVAAAVELAVSSAAKPIPKASAFPPLNAAAHKLEEMHNNRYKAIAALGSTPEDYDLHPEMWSLLGGLVMHDRITLVTKEWLAEFVVVDVGAGYVNAKIMTKITLPRRAQSERARLPPGYRVRQAEAEDNAVGCWVVERESDSWPMNANVPLQTEQEAIAWLMGLAIFRGQDSTTYLP